MSTRLGRPWRRAGCSIGGCLFWASATGMQALVHQLGGKVVPGLKQEFGSAVLHQEAAEAPIFHGLPPSLQVWMSHGDRVEQLPHGFTSLAYTENSPVAAIGDGKKIFGLQFHPEVRHTPLGQTVLENFLFKVCSCTGSWTPSNFVNDSINRIRRQVGDGLVICALSGGVDSAVTAVLLHKAIGDQLTCIFVNNGLLRLEEAERVQATFNRNLGLNLVYTDASHRFLEQLAGVTDPEVKRKVIGEEFIRVFEDVASELGKPDFLAQGTLYSDVIESAASDNRASARIKTHHNVGGLPQAHEASTGRALKVLVQRRSPRGRHGFGIAGRDGPSPTFSRTWAGHQGDWRGNQRAGWIWSDAATG